MKERIALWIVACLLFVSNCFDSWLLLFWLCLFPRRFACLFQRKTCLLCTACWAWKVRLFALCAGGELFRSVGKNVVVTPWFCRKASIFTFVGEQLTICFLMDRYYAYCPAVLGKLSCVFRFQ